MPSEGNREAVGGGAVAGRLGMAAGFHHHHPYPKATPGQGPGHEINRQQHTTPPSLP